MQSRCQSLIQNLQSGRPAISCWRKGTQTSSSSVDKSCSPASSFSAFSSSNSFSRSGSDSLLVVLFFVLFSRSGSGRFFDLVDLLC